MPRCPRRRWIARALLFAALVVSVIGLSDQVLMPMHAREAGEDWLFSDMLDTPRAAVNGLSRVLEVPGNFLLWGVVARLPFGGVLTSRRPWGTFLCLSFLFYGTFFGFLLALNARLNRWASAGKQLSEGAAAAGPPEPAPGPRVSRRRVLIAAKSAVVGGVAVAGGYPLLVEPRRLSITRLAFPVRDLPPSLDGLRVVQLTDIHLGPWNTLEYVRQVVQAANALDPDVIALTGDYVLQSSHYIEPVAKTLGGLRAKLGVVGVLGNHDWREDGSLTRRALLDARVRLVDNDRVFVTPARRLTDDPSEGLCIAGVGDLWTDRQLYGQALGGLPPEMPRLLLSHNPDVAEEPMFVGSGHRVDLMLSGHTHGGQIYLPGVGAMVTMSRYGQKYVRGLVRGPTCPVYVSRGLGMAMLPLRFGSVPEIAVIQFRRE